MPWLSGSLSELEYPDKALKSRGTVTVRAVLPAFGDLPEVTANTQTITYRPGTTVSVISGWHIVATPQPI